VSGRGLASTNSASRNWISAIGPHLHDSVTEITQTGPQELTFVRKSSIGFTGFELTTLSVWLDSPGFPYRIELPPFLHAGMKRPAGTNAPPPRPSGKK
jgi:hypothetical protein